MADIFEEVEEGIRQEKWTERWRRYGIFAYLFAAVLIGGTALNEYLQYSRATALETNSEAYETALDALTEGNYEQAAAGFAALVEKDTRISAPAGHMLAEVRLDGNGDPAAAADVLESVAANSDTATGKLALIKAAYLEADTMDRAALAAMLEPLRADEGSAFRALATELLATKAMADGDYEYARQELSLLRVMPNKPPGLDTRVRKALAVLPPAAPIADPEAAADTEAAPEESE